MNENLIAILRGIHPEQVESVAQVIIEAGISHLEVPLNSPAAVRSIELLSRRFGSDAVIGAGTVVIADDVARVAAAGGTFIVSPNCDVTVINSAQKNGLSTYPGVLTPSECFAAIHAGATALKIFPASMMGLEGLRALRAVLPVETRLLIVGGIDHSSFAPWLSAGANGFGIGSALYQPGKSLANIAVDAKRFAEAFQHAS